MSILSSHFCKPVPVWASQLSWLQRAMKFWYAIANSSSLQQSTSLFLINLPHERTVLWHAGCFLWSLHKLFITAWPAKEETQTWGKCDCPIHVLPNSQINIQVLQNSEVAAWDQEDQIAQGLWNNPLLSISSADLDLISSSSSSLQLQSASMWSLVTLLGRSS